jgi:hypothetical protein
MKKIVILALVAVTCSSCAPLLDFLDSTTRLLNETEHNVRQYQPPRRTSRPRRYCFEPYETISSDSVSLFLNSSPSVL